MTDININKINNIIVFGSNGMLGNYLYKYFNIKNYNVTGITRKEFDVNADSITKLESFLKEKLNSNSCVINCIGIIPQRRLPSNNESSLYFIINSIFPLVLEKICIKYNCHFIHASTDCVYNGLMNNEKYNENDIPNEENVYGLSKFIGEPLRSTVIRSSIIGEEKYNKHSFLEWVRNSKTVNINEINGFNNHYWNGVTCLQYCKIVEKIITSNLFWKGIRHIYSPDKKSKYELCCIINEVYKLDLKINSISTSKAIDKTLFSVFKINEKFEIPCIKEQIIEQSNFSID